MPIEKQQLPQSLPMPKVCVIGCYAVETMGPRSQRNKRYRRRYIFYNLT